MYEYPDSLDIKVALIVGSSDIPATQKLFAHGSVVMKCYRCEKRSTYSHDYKKTHYGGMEDYDEWMTRPADPLLHRQYAQRICRRSEEHTSELQSHSDLVCRLLLEKKTDKIHAYTSNCLHTL